MGETSTSSARQETTGKLMLFFALFIGYIAVMNPFGNITTSDLGYIKELSKFIKKHCNKG